MSARNLEYQKLLCRVLCSGQECKTPCHMWGWWFKKPELQFLHSLSFS